MNRVDLPQLVTSISGTLFAGILVVRALGLPSSTYQATIFTIAGAIFGGTAFALLPFRRLDGKPYKRVLVAICIFFLVYTVMKKWEPLR